VSVLDRLGALLHGEWLGDVGRRELVAEQVRASLSDAKQEMALLLSSAVRADSDRAKLEREAVQWEQRAMTAVGLGRDDLARQALKRKLELGQQAHQLEVDAQGYRNDVSRLKTLLRQVEVRLRSASSGNLDGFVGLGKAFNDFGEVEQRLEGEFAESELDDELGGGPLRDAVLQRQIEDLDRSAQADDELARLKAQAAAHPGAARPSGAKRGAASVGGSGTTERAGKDLARDQELADELDSIRRQLGADGTSDGSETDG